MLSLQPDNYNWLSLLFVLIIWSGLAALITVGITVKRSHHFERTLNDCLVALMPGYASFYLTILFAPVVNSSTSKQWFGAFLAAQLSIFVIGLLLINATKDVIKTHQPHRCPPTGCTTPLHPHVQRKIFGWNLTLNVISLLAAAYVALSPWVVTNPVAQ